MGSDVGILVAKASLPISPLTALRHVHAEHGISAARQLWEIARLGRGRGKLPPADYYSSGVYRQSKSWPEKTYYVSDLSSYRVNRELQPAALSTHRAMFNDKMLSSFVLQAMGFPVSKTLAIYIKRPRYGDFPQITTREGLIAALSNPPDAGMFGKPIDGLQGIGAVSINRHLGAGKLQLLSGRDVDVGDLADEILKRFPQGYLLQERLHMHPEIARRLGEAVATLRVCTIYPESGPELLYACLRMPAKNALIDSGDGNGSSAVDPVSAKILSAMRGDFPYDSPITAAENGAEALIGFEVPFYHDSINMVISAHRAFPDHGILGWDVVLTPQGPRFNEVNTNPGHMIWQRAADRGFLNPEHLARHAPVRAFLAAKLAATKSKKA